MDYKSRSVRLDDETWEALRAHPLSANQLLRTALGLNSAQPSAASTGRMPRLYPMVDEADADVSQVLEMVEERMRDNRPKNAYCKHCGERFAGQRFATLCPNCKSVGHTNQPNECPRCNEGMGI